MKTNLLIITIISFFFISCSGKNEKNKPIAIKGSIDLQGWDFEKNGNLKLDGEWEFYWNKLLKPEEINKNKPGYINVPASWINKIVESKNLSKQGYATYKLKILTQKPQRLYLYYNPPPTSSKLYFNGKLLKLDGKPAITQKDEVPNEITETIALDLNKLENNLVINISNYSNFGSGLSKELIIGKRHKVNSILINKIAIDVFLAGALFVIGIYQLFQFLFRKKNKSSLWLSLFAINLGIRSIMSNERYIAYLFDNIPWEICVRIDLLTISIGVPLLVKFFDSLYEDVINKFITLFFYFFGYAYSLIIIFSPVEIYSHLLYYYHGIIVLCGCYLTVIMIWCSYKKKEGALISTIGFFIMYSAVLFDILVSWYLFDNFMITSLGLVFFFIAQSLNLSLSFFKAYNRVEKFSSVMENTVKLRNKELYQERDQLKKRNEMMNAELDLAKKIQQKLIPRAAPVNFISCFYKPMEKVGGDFYEFFKFRDPNQVGIFISDVSGHGVPAAFITSMIKTIILQSGSRRNDPAELFHYLNDLLLNQTAGNFITAIYAIINTKSKKVIYSNAGHNDPYLISNNSISQIKKIKRVPLSVFNNNTLQSMNKTFKNNEFTVKEGDKLFLYTDGLTEATNDIDYNYFEDVKLKPILESSYELNCHELQEKIYKELTKFRGNESFDDDICMICVDF